MGRPAFVGKLVGLGRELKETRCPFREEAGGKKSSWDNRWDFIFSSPA